MRITYGKNVYGKAEIDAVVTQLKKKRMGKSVNNFEKGIARRFSKKYKLFMGKAISYFRKI